MFQRVISYEFTKSIIMYQKAHRVALECNNVTTISQKFHDRKTQKHCETKGVLFFTLHLKFENKNKLKFKPLKYYLGIMKIEHVVFQKHRET